MILENKWRTCWKDTFEDIECAKDLSSADFLRFISTNKCKETGKQWYEFSSSYLNNEAENYVDKYIDEMAKKYSNNFNSLLRYLYYPVTEFENKRGFEILKSKYNKQ